MNFLFKGEEWYIDSGASVHLTAREDWLEKIRDPSLEEIMVANKMKIPVSSQGDVNITTRVKNGFKTDKFNVTIQDAMFAPDLSTN